MEQNIPVDDGLDALRFREDKTIMKALGPNGTKIPSSPVINSSFRTNIDVMPSLQIQQETQETRKKSFDHFKGSL